MKNYELTIEDGVITWNENADENSNPIEGILYIPKEAIASTLMRGYFLAAMQMEL